MNREIKFRAWNEQDGMCLPWTLSEVLDKAVTANFDPAPEGTVFMQFTGLKDHRGRDIYESDIIDTFDPIKLEQGQDADVRGVVRYREDRGYYFLEVNGEFYQLLGNLESPEVIGTIYENGDLLPS